MMREHIVKYLGTVQQSTAKTISLRIGIDQLEVARELNHMLSDGVVEREKKPGGGNEYHYWLSRADRTPASSDQVPPVEAKAAIEPGAEPATAALERQIASLQNQIVDLHARRDADAAERLQVEAERDELKVENESLKDGIAKLHANNEALEKRIDDLTGVDPGFKPHPLFVTIGRYAKPQRHNTIEKARRRASSLIRAEKESEVLVCEPVGRVVRGSEWRPV
jgi:hypothetical protein